MIIVIYKAIFGIPYVVHITPFGVLETNVYSKIIDLSLVGLNPPTAD